MEEKRTCTLCGKTAELSLFVKDNSKPSGYRNKCRECHNKNNVEWRKDNPEKNRESQRQHMLRKKNKKQIN